MVFQLKDERLSKQIFMLDRLKKSGMISNAEYSHAKNIIANRQPQA